MNQWFVCLDPTCEDEELDGMKAFKTLHSALKHQETMGHAIMERNPRENMKVNL